MAPLKPIDVPSFATTQLALLDAELQSEVTETTLLLSNSSPNILARAGLAITNLALASLRTGLGGKTVVELVPDPAVANASASSTELPEHGIRVGDIVAVAEQPAAGSVRRRGAGRESQQERGRHGGVVVRVARAAVAVALDDRDEASNDNAVPAGRLWLVKLANDVTYKR
jgi:DNA polymerase alpha-associated DNA helicase A